MLELVDRSSADGIALRHIDLGGGLGIRYRDETAIDPRRVRPRSPARAGPRPQRAAVRARAFLVGDAGVLLTRVTYLKPGRTAISRSSTRR